MNMSKLIKTDAMILKTISLPGSSRFVIAFTKEMGKITLVAKGIRKPKSRFGACLEPFVLSEVIFYYKENRENYYVSHCAIIDPHNDIRQNLEKIQYASMVSALTNQLITAEEKNVTLFNLIFSIFTELNRSTTSELSLLYMAYQLKLMTILGFQPILNRCANCQNQVDLTELVYFSINKGGPLCYSCANGITLKRQIDSSGVTLLRHFLTDKFVHNKKLKINKTLEAQIMSLLKSYIEFHSEREIKVLPGL